MAHSRPLSSRRAISDGDKRRGRPPNVRRPIDYERRPGYAPYDTTIAIGGDAKSRPVEIRYRTGGRFSKTPPRPHTLAHQPPRDRRAPFS